MPYDPSRPTCRFASALSGAATPAALADELLAKLPKTSESASWAALFASPHYEDDLAELSRRLRERLGTDCLLGCTCDGVAVGGQEVEQGSAVALLVGWTPEAELRPIRLEMSRTPEGATFLGWPDDLPEASPESFVLLLADPFSFPADAWLARMNEDRAQLRFVGGLASGAYQPGGNRLLLGEAEYREGAVALWISGGVQMRSVVSQGCRPIGEPLIITKAERNLIHELSGRPAMEVAYDVFQQLPVREQKLVQQGLHLGRVVSEYRDRFEPGDFLIRNVMGVDPDSQALAIGDYVRVGQTVQLHIRDEESADSELRNLLAAVRDRDRFTPQAALLFTCNGRGTRLFSQPHHDAGCVQESFGDLPLAGFFAQGEIGPVGAANYLHGFTASLALFGSSL